jgi:hypothetical protein
MRFSISTEIKGITKHHLDAGYELAIGVRAVLGDLFLVLEFC